jgi:acetyl esterase
MQALLESSGSGQPKWAAALDRARLGQQSVSLAAAEARENYDAETRLVAGEPVALHAVEDIQVPTPQGARNARMYRPEGPTDDGFQPPVVVFFHGGAWIIGSIESHDNLCRRLALSSGAVVISLDYRMAPEHPYPAGLDDCCSTIRWVHENATELHVDADRIAVAGDSAGGNLAAAAALRLRDEEGIRPALQLLMYPALDSSVTSESWRELGHGYRLLIEHQHWYYAQYVPERTERSAPYVSPGLADNLFGLPPAFIQTAEYDPLRDEGEQFAGRLSSSGVPATAKRYPGVIHGFMRFHGLQASEDALTDAGSALREAFSKR